ncbi:hypothetical protein BD408DRAFT_470985 [Parasitella parasitica]|nr:hypothetical protein BD408DRAFT_470985 [Parasitella parasitica]
MSDLRQAVITLNQERIEIKTKLESFEDKFGKLSVKFKAFSTTESCGIQQDTHGYSHLLKECEMIKQEMKLLKETYTAVLPVSSSQGKVSQNYELLASKVPDLEIESNALQIRMAEFDEKIEAMTMRSITAIEDGNKVTHALKTQLEELETKTEMFTRDSAKLDKTIILETRLNELANDVGKMVPLEDQPVIKLLLEQSLSTEYLIETITEDIKQISTKFNNQIRKNENEKKSINFNGEADNQALKKEVAELTNEIQCVNHAIGKLQTVTHEQYRTLLPTVQKVNENSDHLAELAAIVDDITSYHLKLVTPNETDSNVVSNQESVQHETHGQDTKASTKFDATDEYIIKQPI